MDTRPYSQDMCLDPQAALLDAYVLHAGWRDEETDAAIAELTITGREPLQLASMLIGQACFKAARNYETEAREVLRTAREILGGVAIKETWKGIDPQPQAEALSLLSMMIEDRDDPAAVNIHRASAYDLSIGTLRSAGDKFDMYDIARTDKVREIASLIIGDITTETTHALINRRHYPNLAAFPALTHHDNTQIHLKVFNNKPTGRPKATSRDLLVIESEPATRSSIITPLQVKAQCLALCPNICDADVAQKSSVRLKASDIRDGYASSIWFVSGKCDLDMRYRLGNDAQFPVADLLIKEYDGFASDEEIRELDRYQQKLIGNLASDNPRRRGSAPAFDEYLGI